jgi:hypothetical protein
VNAPRIFNLIIPHVAITRDLPQQPLDHFPAPCLSDLLLRLFMVVTTKHAGQTLSAVTLTRPLSTRHPIAVVTQQIPLRHRQFLGSALNKFCRPPRPDLLLVSSLSRWILMSAMEQGHGAYIHLYESNAATSQPAKRLALRNYML